MNNTTSSCNRSADMNDLISETYFVIYYVISPISCVISVFGHIGLLIAFRLQSRGENAYVYQLLLTISKLCESIAYTFLIIAYKLLSNADHEGVEWFTKSYALMWYAAHVSIPLTNCFTTSSLLFSIVMAADRIAAILRPFKYKNFNHRLFQKIAAIFCFTLGIGSNVFDCFRYTVFGDGNTIPYTIGIDFDYVLSESATILSEIRMGFRVALLVGLIGLNIAMTALFRSRSNKVAQMTNRDPRERKRRDTDKTLLMLTLWQSFLTCLGVLPINTVYVMAYVVPQIVVCWGDVLFTLSDLAISIEQMAEFFVVLAINKKLQKLIRKVLPCYRNEAEPVSITAWPTVMQRTTAV